LATILVTCKKIGKVNVFIEVMHRGQVVKPDDKLKNVCSIINVFKKAFDTNYYFESVELRKVMSRNAVFPVFKKEVIQFFNDDLSDLYNNFNGVAASVFSEVLKLSYDDISIYPSTSINKRCEDIVV